MHFCLNLSPLNTGHRFIWARLGRAFRQKAEASGMQERKSLDILGILTQCKMSNRHKQDVFQLLLNDFLAGVISNLHSPNALCDNPALKMH